MSNPKELVKPPQWELNPSSMLMWERKGKRDLLKQLNREGERVNI